MTDKEKWRETALMHLELAVNALDKSGCTAQTIPANISREVALLLPLKRATNRMKVLREIARLRQTTTKHLALKMSQSECYIRGICNTLANAGMVKKVRTETNARGASYRIVWYITDTGAVFLK